eukprot:7022552-Alexandrium_andersonii.AAC.1
MPPDNATCLTDDALLSHIRTPLIIETCSGLCHGIAACAHATTIIQGHNMCALGILGQDSTHPQHFLARCAPTGKPRILTEQLRPEHNFSLTTSKANAPNANGPEC